MIDDIEKLLSKADGPAPLVRADLASAVRQAVAQRRQRKRRVALAAIALVVGGSAAAIVSPRSRPTSVPIAENSIDIAAYRREIADLEADAKLHLRVALAIERERAAERSPSESSFSEPDILLQVDLRRQVAAQLMLSHAELLAADPAKRDEATANYKKVVALFPETLASRAANDRLRATGV